MRFFVVGKGHFNIEICKSTAFEICKLWRFKLRLILQTKTNCLFVTAQNRAVTQVILTSVDFSFFHCREDVAYTVNRCPSIVPPKSLPTDAKLFLFPTICKD